MSSSETELVLDALYEGLKPLIRAPIKSISITYSNNVFDDVTYSWGIEAIKFNKVNADWDSISHKKYFLGIPQNQICHFYNIVEDVASSIPSDLLQNVLSWSGTITITKGGARIDGDR